MSAGQRLRTSLTTAPRFGTFLKLGRPEAVDVIAAAGFDFAVLDLEHGQASHVEARESLLAARANSLATIVRVGSLDPSQVNRLLEAGAAGIQLSTVTSARQARDLERALRYQPVGDRSISLAQPSAGYGATSLTDYLDEYTMAPLVVGQLETVSYLDEFDAILEPLDVAFIGPADLSVAAGTPGDVTRGEAARVIAEVEIAAARTRTALGIFVADADAARSAAVAGYRYIVVGSDLAMLARTASGIRGAIGDPLPEVSR